MDSTTDVLRLRRVGLPIVDSLMVFGDLVHWVMCRTGWQSRRVTESVYLAYHAVHKPGSGCNRAGYGLKRASFNHD